jgi:TorA maturation chaperone TorD
MNAPVLIDESDLARADAYALMAHVLFAPPAPALLATMQQMGHGATAEDEMTAAWCTFCDMAGDATAIGNEYNALFISIGKPQVSLYASWYLTGFLMEKPLALLRDDLVALGLERQAEQKLEVMRHLIMRSDTSAQQQFFQRHLEPWYSDFCTALDVAEDARFYKALSRFMRTFLNMERDYFRLQAADGGVK